MLIQSELYQNYLVIPEIYWETSIDVAIAYIYANAPINTSVSLSAHIHKTLIENAKMNIALNKQAEINQSIVDRAYIEQFINSLAPIKPTLDGDAEIKQ